MSQIGSTSARRWPIRCALRSRLALAVGSLFVALSAAHADWETKDVPGTPSDVQVWSPGVFSVTTTSGAYLFRPDAGTPLAVPSTQTVGNRLKSTGCLEVFLKNDSVTGSPAGCSSGFVFGGGTYELNRVRTTGSGAAYLLGKQPPQQLAIAFSPSESGPWGPASKPQFSGTPMALGVLRQGTSEQALFALGGRPDRADLYWLIDGVPQTTYTLVDTSAFPKDVQAIDLFPAGGSTPTALFGWVGKLYRGPLVSGTQPAFAPVTLPVDPVAITGVDVNTGAGSAYGEGFGMATVQQDGGVALLSAVPAGQPQDIGLQWRINPTLPALANAPRYLACQGSQFCVMAQNAAPPGNLLVYTNASPPSLTVDPNTSLPESTSRTLAIRASDPDGDAVRVTVSPNIISTPALSMKPTDVNGGVDLSLSAGPVCADTSFGVTVAASDGLSAHDQIKNLSLQVIHTRRGGSPGIVPSTNIVVQAGGPQAAILATPPAAPPPPAPPPCPISDYRWTALTPSAPALISNGASAVFPTPPVLCQRDGASYVYRVESLDESGLSSDPRDFTVQVRPWGKPFAPFNTDQQVDLVAGGGARLTPENTHMCNQPNVGFPGVDTQWLLTDGKPLPPGIRLRAAQDGTLVTGLSAVTPELLVETDECAAGQVQLSATHFTRDGSGIAGDPSAIHVSVDPQWVPISNGMLKLDASATTPERIAGMASVEGLNCIAQRGGVKARMRLWRLDGTLAQQKEFRVPGPWEFPIDAVCEGQSYRLEAELVEGPGFTAQALPSGKLSALPLVQVDISVPPVEVSLRPSETARLVAQCGQAASGTLEQRLPVGPCSGLPLTWEYVSGPELTQSSFTGQQINLTTKETDFGSLLGQSVVLRVTANTGKVTQIEQRVPITAEPFVQVERHVENAVGTDTDLIGVSVDMHNTTACTVGQVDHVERVVGADYVPGSARFNDVPVEASMDGDLLTARGLDLQGSGTGRLTYVVRPRLLGSSRFEGQSFVRGVPVSQLPPEPPAGCGCDGGGSGFAALGLAGLAAVLSRRRER